MAIEEDDGNTVQSVAARWKFIPSAVAVYVARNVCLGRKQTFRIRMLRLEVLRADRYRGRPDRQVAIRAGPHTLRRLASS